MSRSSYREQDHAFGQLMLRLRTAVGLTQSGLADFLHVTRHAVGGWEAGQSYPKADHLKRFIELALQQGAFTAGRQAEEIRELWRSARQKVLLEEHWLQALLSEHDAASQPAVALNGADTLEEPPTSVGPLLDWGDAPDAPALYGREGELAHLTRWIAEERCRVVCVVGMGGIGKSALAVAAVRRVASQFDAVVWRSLDQAPSCEALLETCLQVLAPDAVMRLPDSLDARLGLLMEQLRSRRVLLVFDNWEALLEHGTGTSRLRAGLEGYARLLRQIAEAAHQSCLLLTSREKPIDLVMLERDQRLVRVLKVAGIGVAAGAQLLAEKGLRNSDGAQERLAELYGGNPLALKIVAQTIVEVFGGDAGQFLAQGDFVYGGVRQLLDEQFDQLSTFERNVVYWLAILREPVTFEDLLPMLRKPQPRARVLEALDGLNRRSMIERGQQPGSFTLHSVVLEHATASIVAEASDELAAGALNRLVAHSLSHAHAKDYVRKAQEQFLLLPVLDRLREAYPEPARLEAHLLGLLAALRGEDQLAQGYGPANLIALLRLLRGDLRGLDLGGLLLRGVFLHGVAMQDTSLSGATLQDSVFTEAFDAVSAVAVSPTGEYWAAATWRGEVRLWKAIGPTLSLVWQAHTIYIASLAFSPNGQSLVSVSWDNTVKLWDVPSGVLQWAGTHAGGINCVAFSPNGQLLASAGGDGLVCVWQARSGARLQTLAAQGGTLFALAWSPDGDTIATGSATGTLALWQQQAPDHWFLAHEQLGHSQWIAGLAYAADGAMIASGSFDGTIKLWDTSNYSCLQTLASHAGRVLRVAWSPDGATLASCTFDHTIWLWDVAEARSRAILRGHSGVIYGLGFAPDGRTLVSGSDDGTVRVWDAARGQMLRVIGGYVATLFDVAWSPDDAQLATAGADSLVTLWKRHDSAPPIDLRGHEWIVQGLAWRPNSQLLASGGYDNSIRLWDTAAGTRVNELRDPASPETIFLGVAWSPDGQLLASGSYQRGVYVWKVGASAPLWVGETGPALIRRVAWNPDGARLVGGGDNGVAYLWDVPRRTLVHRLEGHSESVTSVAWNRSGTRLASGGGSAMRGGEVFVWDAQSGARVQTLAGIDGVVFSVAWSADGEVLVSGGSDGTLRWWDVASGACLRALPAHRGTVQALALSHDGTTLASCGDDGAIALWDIRSGAQLQVLRRDRPYERMEISGLAGITDAQRASLIALGAFEEREEVGMAPDGYTTSSEQLVNAARQARAEGEYQQATTLFERASAGTRSQLESWQVTHEMAIVLREQGHFARASALFEESAAHHRAVGDRALLAIGLLGLADVARDQGDAERIQQYGEEALAIVRELDMPLAVGFTLNTLALGAYYRGELAAAATRIRESEALFRTLRADRALGEVLITAGKIERAQGNMAAAHAAMAEALRLTLATGPRLFMAASLEGLGSIAAAQGRAEESVRLLALAAALRQHMGAPPWPADTASLEAALAIGRALLGDKAFADIWAGVQALSLDQLLDALASLDQSQPR